ncbi:MAG TPA: YjbE family putative metal transport protein [Pseudomonadales bacterium]|nr:YjbE family putative metal transport protein [Pseudomonadales bacterium]
MTWIAELSAFFQVILVDLVLAGDNAIVIAMVVANFPARQRAQLLMMGICAATVVRVVFAVATVHLMQIVGLMLAGGLLLLWVCWKLWREIESVRAMELSPAGIYGHTQPAPTKTVGRAITQIVIADVSMSLDNVLAVAGVARNHTWVLIFGLTLSIAFMGFCATVLARWLQRYHWIAYVGLLTILYVACAMVWDGSMEVVRGASVAFN